MSMGYIILYVYREHTGDRLGCWRAGIKLDLCTAIIMLHNIIAGMTFWTIYMLEIDKLYTTSLSILTSNKVMNKSNAA